MSRYNIYIHGFAGFFKPGDRFPRVSLVKTQLYSL